MQPNNIPNLIHIKKHIPMKAKNSTSEVIKLNSKKSNALKNQMEQQLIEEINLLQLNECRTPEEKLFILVKSIHVGEQDLKMYTRPFLKLIQNKNSKEDLKLYQKSLCKALEKSNPGNKYDCKFSA